MEVDIGSLQLNGNFHPNRASVQLLSRRDRKPQPWVL
jgi:hypothetical protein